MPKISVIVPVYKVESYLDRCVESILNQTHRDFELILVDDGSPDNCPAMCDAWAEKDSRIKVLHKENGGLSDARNVGFAASEGQWITFIDSDDYVHPQMLQALYGAVTELGVQVSICGYAETTGEPLDTQVPQPKLWTPEGFYREQCVNATVAWGKLYRRDTVLAYPVGKLHEDEFVTYRILFDCEKIAVVDAPLYGYYQNPASITRSVWDPRHLQELVAMEAQCDFFEEKGYHALFRKRARDYVKVAMHSLEKIEGLENAEAYQKEKDWMLERGRRMLTRCKGRNIFSLGRDGWMIQPFYPKTVKCHGFLMALWGKVGRKI